MDNTLRILYKPHLVVSTTVVVALLLQLCCSFFYPLEECRKFLVEANDSNEEANDSNSLVIGRYDFTGESLRPVKDAEFTLSLC